MAKGTKGDLLKRIEKSASEKRANFMKGCNADPDLKDFEEKKRIALYALKLTKGNISNACKMISISRQMIHYYINDDPEFQEMYKDIRLSVVEYVEDKLMSRINSGSDTAIIYFLNCQGKEQGWGNSVKVDGSMKNINYNVPLTDEEVRQYAKALEEEI